MSFDLSSMERGELCRDRCMSLLLADPVQDTGAARPNAGGGDVQALDLSPGFGDFGDWRDAFACVGVEFGACRSGVLGCAFV